MTTTSKKPTHELLGETLPDSVELHFPGTTEHQVRCLSYDELRGRLQSLQEYYPDAAGALHLLYTTDGRHERTFFFRTRVQDLVLDHEIWVKISPASLPSSVVFAPEAGLKPRVLAEELQKLRRMVQR